TNVRPEQFNAMQARCDELMQTLDKGESVVGEVTTDYQRILKELITNRVEQAMIERVDKHIVGPLTVAVNGNEEDKNARDTFPKARAGITDLRAAVAAEGDFGTKLVQSRNAATEAQLRLDALIRRLIGVLEKMEALADINKIIKLIQEVEQEE